MSSTQRVWSAFSVGLAGGLLLASLSPTPVGSRSPSVEKVAGVDNGVSVATDELAAIPDDVSEPLRSRKVVAPDASAKLSPQEVARRALQWTASIRGEGVYGAGIVVDPRGYVLTNHHVVNGVEKIRVSFTDTEDLPATIVDYDKDLDLALLKVEVTRQVSAPPTGILTAEVGDDVFAVGSPRKMNFTVSRGMVSFVGRRIDGRYYLQSDLPTNDGNSGGPVVNDRGEVVGVMTFILRDSQGLAFAVPIEYAYERFADQLKSDRVDLARFKRWREDKDRATASR